MLDGHCYHNHKGYLDLLRNFKEKGREISDFIKDLGKTPSFSCIPTSTLQRIVQTLGMISFSGDISKMGRIGFLQNDDIDICVN